MYTKIHESFFESFPFEFYQWIAKLTDNQGRCRLNKPIVWTPQLVPRLEASEDKIACVVDYLLNQIIGGFIIEFVVDTSVSYSEVE